MGIRIYTTSTCATCHTVKRYLQHKKLAYEEVNLEDHPERRDELMQLTGQATVPVTVVTRDDGSEVPVVGMNFANLSAALV